MKHSTLAMKLEIIKHILMFGRFRPSRLQGKTFIVPKVPNEGDDLRASNVFFNLQTKAGTVQRGGRCKFVFQCTGRGSNEICMCSGKPPAHTSEYSLGYFRRVSTYHFNYRRFTA